MIDHLVYAGPSLDDLVTSFVDRTGLEPEPGGQHLGAGTRNYLVGLGGSSYLELIGPDPDQAPPAGPRPFGIDELERPMLITWCLRPKTALATAVANCRSCGFDPGMVSEMSRRRPDGSLLEWSLTSRPFAGPSAMPFLIDWGVTSHPAAALDHPATLVSLQLRHSRAEHLSDLLTLLDTPSMVADGGEGLSAVLGTPNGLVEL